MFGSGGGTGGPGGGAETGYSYGRHVPPHPILPLSWAVALHAPQPVVVFFYPPSRSFCSKFLFKMLCVLSFMFVVLMILCSVCLNITAEVCSSFSHVTLGGGTVDIDKVYDLLNALFIRDT